MLFVGVMAPPPPKRRSSSVSLLPAGSLSQQKFVYEALNLSPHETAMAIENADYLMREIQGLIDAQALHDDDSLGSSFLVHSGSSLPHGAQPRGSFVSASTFATPASPPSLPRSSSPEGVPVLPGGSLGRGSSSVRISTRVESGPAPHRAPAIVLHVAECDSDDENYAHRNRAIFRDSDYSIHDLPAPSPQKPAKKRTRDEREPQGIAAPSPLVGRRRSEPLAYSIKSERNGDAATNDAASGSVRPKRSRQDKVATATDDVNDDDATQRPPFVFVGTTISSEDVIFLEQTARSLGGIVAKSFADRRQVTHVVTDAKGENRSTRSLKYLQGILRHCWIVNMSWVKQSSLAGRWLPEEKYEIQGDLKGSAFERSAPSSAEPNELFFSFRPDLGGPRSSRLQGPSAPSLLREYRIVLVGDFNAPPKPELEALLGWAGAAVLSKMPRSMDRRRKEGTFYLVDRNAESFFETLEALDEVEARCVLNLDWILDSLSRFEVLPTRHYQVREEND